MPVATGELPNVNLIIALTPRQWGDFGIDDKLQKRPEFNVDRKEIDLTATQGVEFVALLNEYLPLRDARFNPTLVGPIVQALDLTIRNDPGLLPVVRLEEKAQIFAKAFFSANLTMLTGDC